MEDRTEPDQATRDAERSDADRRHEADRPATEVEGKEADEVISQGDPRRRHDVADHEKEMMEIGAAVKGEGELE